jgi:DNA-binding response OmpR family regulator
MAVILIVEDNKNTQLLAAARLKPYFDVLCADDGLEALDILYSQHIDLLIADVMMPNMDGYELVRRLRSEGNHTPVLLLTAKHSFEDKREGFTAGSDDYMTKPVDYDELLLRVNALLRRAKISAERKIEIGQLRVDASAHSVKYGEEEWALPKREFDLLYKFLSYPGKIFTKNQLLDEVWGLDADVSEDTIKTHINRIRNRFKDCDEFEIITIKGLGYKAETKKGMR